MLEIMTARLDWNPNPRTPGPMPWPEIPLRSNSTARARTPWHREPRGEVVTGTEDQSSPHSLICEKPDERGSWFEESSPRSSAWDTGPDLRRDHAEEARLATAVVVGVDGPAGGFIMLF